MPHRTVRFSHAQEGAVWHGNAAGQLGYTRPRPHFGRLRDRLAEQIDTIESSRDLAVLASRLQAVMAELDDLPQSQPLSKADEIAERRRQRRAQPS